ncbi:MAG: DUF2334 domain-containing protein [Candidatus Andersenbacteria bacterium]|nr:DUF2334 domain-containing protein [Candidatus Andersenbacteria bacterium]
MKQFSAKYILRIDDVCPTMNWELFSMITDTCDELGIAPILGVIPDNQDQALVAAAPHNLFWEYIKKKASQGWIIAQHGYQHIYEQHKKTEFAGLSYDAQFEKIQSGRNILLKQLGFAPTWWMAPAHSFDETTCKALEALGFEYITDGTALYPYKKHGLTWIPQQLWRPRAMPFGTWTICLHTNTMSAQNIRDMIEFMKKHRSQFLDISLAPRASVLNPLFALAWNIFKIAKSL